jgi:hypothetical protein
MCSCQFSFCSSILSVKLDILNSERMLVLRFSSRRVYPVLNVGNSFQLTLFSLCLIDLLSCVSQHWHCLLIVCFAKLLSFLLFVILVVLFFCLYLIIEKLNLRGKFSCVCHIFYDAPLCNFWTPLCLIFKTKKSIISPALILLEELLFFVERSFGCWHRVEVGLLQIF